MSTEGLHADHDVIVIGGSFAGLSAAMYLARARRKVVVLDTGLPRNRFAAHSHGFFGQDGAVPSEMLKTGRGQVAAYPTVSFVDVEAVGATREGEGFAVELATGEVLRAARLVLAFGISDGLPDVPGLAERWGKTVIHCPYCHGYEFADRRLGVLYVAPMSVHQVRLIPEWGPTTFYLNGAELTGEEVEAMDEIAARGVAVEPAPVVALHGEGTDLSAIELGDGRLAEIDALYTATRTRLNSPIAEQLGCELTDAMTGPMVVTDGQQATTVPGIFAAGDITRAGHSVTWASADGVMAGMATHRSLVF